MRGPAPRRRDDSRDRSPAHPMTGQAKAIQSLAPHPGPERKQLRQRKGRVVEALRPQVTTSIGAYRTSPSPMELLAQRHV